MAARAPHARPPHPRRTVPGNYRRLGRPLRLRHPVPRRRLCPDRLRRPAAPRGLYRRRPEHERDFRAGWIVTLCGGGVDYAPNTEAEWIAFARSLPSGEVYNLV